MSLPSQEEIIAAFSDKKISAGRRLLLDALQSGISSPDHVSPTVHLLKNLLFQNNNDSDVHLEEHIVDSLWLVSCSILDEVEPKKKDKEPQEEKSQGAADSNGKGSSSNAHRDALLQILQNLVDIEDGKEEENETLLNKKKSLAIQLQSHLDPALLEAAGLVASEKDLMKKLRMLNTKNYRQHKFNLLQEESEGYAKVLEGLVKQDYSQLKTIMGTFHVDPNRILDLALDVLIETSTSGLPSDLSWLKEFSTPKIPALISFKLKNVDSPQGAQRILQIIAALAIQEPSILPLTRMSRYLEPIEELLDQTFPLYTKIERKRVLNVGKVRLGGGSSAAQSKEAERDAKEQDKLQGMVKDLEQTHRFQLMDILLKKQQWKLVQTLFPDSAELKKVLTLFPNLGLAICDWIQDRITPLFAKYCPVPEGLSQEPKKEEESKLSSDLDVSAETEVVEMVSEPLLSILDSSCIVRRPTLFCQLCRVLRALLLKEHATKEDTISPSPALYTFIQSFILPSLSMYQANPSLVMEVWSILELFPYTTRYRLYRDWRGVGLERAGLQPFGDKKKPLVLVESEMNAGKNARYVLKRLAKETIRESCRQIAKVSHNNPLVIFTTVLGQIESYDNLVSVMVDTMRFVSPLGMDVLGFCMLSRLCGSSSTDGDRSRSKGMKEKTKTVYDTFMLPSIALFLRQNTTIL